jgi:integrase
MNSEWMPRRSGVPWRVASSPASSSGECGSFRSMNWTHGYTPAVAKRRMSGEGSIFPLKDGRWRAQVSIGPRSNRRFVTRTVRSRSEARAALDDLKGDQRSGLTRTKITTGDYLERWVENVRNIRPATRQGYRAVVTYHLAPLLGPVRLADLSPLHVEAALGALSPRMSPKSLKNVHAVLRRALTQAVRAGLVSRNVAGREYVDAPKASVDEPDALTVDETARLLEAIKGDRMEAAVITALGTGLRPGELLGLAWEDVGSDSIRVRYELARRDGRYVRVDPKTERSRRTVPLSPAVREALDAHRSRLVAEGFVPTETGPVFPNRQGGALNGSWLTHHFYDLLEKAGVRRVPFKILRATYATRLHEAGISDRQIADLMGHTRTRTTHGHYITTAGADQSVAVAAVEAVLSQSPSKSRSGGMASPRGVQ